MAENKVRFGLSNVAVAFINHDGEGEVDYETPIMVPGAVTLTRDAEGDQSTFYADNSAYYTINSNAGYTGELTMALVPDEIKARMLGWKIDANGALVEIADSVPEQFALLYRLEGDQKRRFNVLYNVTVNRPSAENNTTEDSAEPETEAMPFTAGPIVYQGEKITQASIEPNEKNTESISSFYQKVYLPNLSTSYKVGTPVATVSKKN